MRVHDFMRTPAAICCPDTQLAEAARQMAAQNVGSLVVVGDGGELAGMITDRDLVVRGVARWLEPETEIAELMTTQVTFVRDDTDAFAAATEMAAEGCRRMPVLNEQGHLVGVVTLDDLLTLFARQTDKLAETVGFEIANPALAR